MKKNYYVFHNDDEILCTQDKEKAINLLSQFITLFTKEELTENFEDALKRGYCGITCTIDEEYSLEVHDEEV